MYVLSHVLNIVQRLFMGSTTITFLWNAHGNTQLIRYARAGDILSSCQY